nr:T9SS type A sorting domain-containing protein [Bacteroidota bacterium]
LGGYSMGPDMVIDHSGVIHVVWSYRIEDWYWKIMYTCSGDYGETWSEPLDLTQNTDLWMSQPHIACDSKNNLYVTYDYATGTPDKLVYMIGHDGHQWSEPIIISEGMPGSDYNKVIVDNNDKLFVFWAYGSQFMYYRYFENSAWSDFYCPYCDSTDIFAFADGHAITDNLMHWVGASMSYNYYGERLQYYLFNISANDWSEPQMPGEDTITVGKDIALNNNDLPECAYRTYPSPDDKTKLIQKKGNYWSDPELVACVNGTQQYQQISVDQNNVVHVVESEVGDNGTKLIHYYKINDYWYGQQIDLAGNMCHFTKLLFKTHKLYVVYHKSETPTSAGDIWFSKYDIITNIKNEPIPSHELKIYPNPSDGNIYIEFVLLASLWEINKLQYIDLSVFDITGKHIITLKNNKIPRGMQRILWNGTDKNGKEVKNGSYLVRLQSGRNIVTQTVEIIK